MPKPGYSQTFGALPYALVAGLTFLDATAPLGVVSDPALLFVTAHIYSRLSELTASRKVITPKQMLILALHFTESTNTPRPAGIAQTEHMC
jgi:hypothetical protein